MGHHLEKARFVPFSGNSASKLLHSCVCVCMWVKILLHVPAVTILSMPVKMTARFSRNT